MLQTPQKYPRAGSQSYPLPAASPSRDGSTTVYFAPSQPQGVKRGNWIQTDPNKGWFTLLRLYSPLEPFFAKTWRAERGDAGAFRRMQAQAMVVGQRRIDLSMRIARLEGPALRN